MSVQSAGFSQGRKGWPQQFCIPLHMVPPPTHLSPYVGIGFGQDQVTWLQLNGISFMLNKMGSAETR